MNINPRMKGLPRTKKKTTLRYKQDFYLDHEYVFTDEKIFEHSALYILENTCVWCLSKL